jgi:hypothetical protein
MKHNPNAKCVYYIKSPDGEEFTNVLDLKEFCVDHGLNYKHAAEQARNEKSYKGWYITRVEKATSEDKKLESFGLSVDERYQKTLDDNTKLRLKIKEIQRESTLFKMLSGVIKESVPVSKVEPYIMSNKKAKINESAILVLSDIHGDQIILPERTQGLENYNFNIACRRAERIVDTTITHLIDNMKGYNFEKLYIFNLGDLVNGDIHPSAGKINEWGNSIKSSMVVGELISLMIKDLAKYFPQIVYVAVNGNHGRFSKKKDYTASLNNWDYLVNSFAIHKLDNLVKDERLTYMIPDSWTAAINIYGYNFILNHGDDIRSFGNIPLYGIERKTRRLTSLGAVSGVIPNYFLYGHFHTNTTQAHPTGNTVINGAWPATDEFALESMGAYNEPCQNLFGVHESYGLTWRLPIILRTKNWKTEELKPGRYNINVI